MVERIENGFPCPACGFYTMDEPIGCYDICAVCGWEDDGVQYDFPSMRGGANRESLVEAQQKALSLFPLGVNEATSKKERYAGIVYKRDLEWRPLREDEIKENAITDGMSYFNAACQSDPEYYWKND